jgi:hypothetical protein
MDEKGRPNRKLNADITFRAKRRNGAWSTQSVISEIVAFRFYDDDERKKVVYEFPRRRRPSKPAVTAEQILLEVEGQVKSQHEGTPDKDGG